MDDETLHGGQYSKKDMRALPPLRAMLAMYAAQPSLMRYAEMDIGVTLIHDLKEYTEDEQKAWFQTAIYLYDQEDRTRMSYVAQAIKERNPRSIFTPERLKAVETAKADERSSGSGEMPQGDGDGDPMELDKDLPHVEITKDDSSQHMEAAAPAAAPEAASGRSQVAKIEHAALLREALDQRAYEGEGESDQS